VDILYSPQGVKWLNETCRRGYARIYRYAWQEWKVYAVFVFPTPYCKLFRV